MPDQPGTIVTLSPQALSALAAADHPASAGPVVPAAAHGGSVYESLKSGISTAAIVARIDAGEQIAEIATDYGLDESEIDEALLYESAA